MTYENKEVMSKNIKRYLQENNMSISELSRKMKLPYTTVNNWVNGVRYPRIDKIEIMAFLFKCQKSDLIEDKTNPLYGIDNIKPIRKVKTVPLIGRIACGTPVLAEENIEDHLILPDDVRADFCLTCCGDSMINAGIEDGDTAYFIQTPIVDNGTIAAVCIDGEATLKRVRYINPRNVHEGIILMPENPNYTPIVLNDENTDVRIIGKMTALLKRF